MNTDALKFYRSFIRKQQVNILKHSVYQSLYRAYNIDPDEIADHGDSEAVACFVVDIRNAGSVDMARTAISVVELALPTYKGEKDDMGKIKGALAAARKVLRAIENGSYTTALMHNLLPLCLFHVLDNLNKEDHALKAVNSLCWDIRDMSNAVEMIKSGVRAYMNLEQFGLHLVRSAIHAASTCGVKEHEIAPVVRRLVRGYRDRYAFNIKGHYASMRKAVIKR